MKTNVLYYGDNLTWLRDHDLFPNDFVDLIYLDPPFNSNADYNVIFNEPGGEQSQAQISAFDDTWHWEKEASERALAELGTSKPELVEIIQWIARRGDGNSKSMAAYLSMMAVRLIELHRILKPTGSLFLHCDPTASHYLKILLDTIFKLKRFKNEIIWRRTGSNSAAKRFGPIHQTILYYGKSEKTYFHPVPTPYTKGYVEDYFTEQDERGQYRPVLLTGPGKRTGDSGKQWRNYDPTSSSRHWQPATYVYKKYQEITREDLSQYPLLIRLDKLDEIGLIHWAKKEGGGVPNYKYYLDDAPGVYLQDIWAYQPGTEGCVWRNPKKGIDQDVKWLSTKDKERLGYDTQKPEGVLERIIRASCPDDGLILDPFCGCGTTVAVAQKLNLNWIGIDVTWLAIDKIEQRLRQAFGEQVISIYEVKGNPTDVASARDLSRRNKKEFEIWALSLVKAAQREHDGGVDGLLSIRESKNKYTKIIVQVKGGENLNPGMVRDLIGTVENENAAMGLFITLEEPTRGMKELATHSGSYTSQAWGKTHPRIQIKTIEELLNGEYFDLPYAESPAKKASPIKKQGKTKRLL